MTWRDESGVVGGLEAIAFGFLVFVAGTLLLVNAWGVYDAHLAASAAAREAVRAFVESTGSDASARAAGESAAAEAIRGHGRSESRMTVAWEDARLSRCQPVTAVVTYRVPLISVPWLGSFAGGAISTSARHREIVDPFGARLDTGGFDPAACSA